MLKLPVNARTFNNSAYTGHLLSRAADMQQQVAERIENLLFKTGS